MDRQRTWEILLLPVGKDAGKGTASVNNPDPGPSPDLYGDGSARGWIRRLTGALLDRLTHHVHILEMNGESYRLNQSQKRRKSPKIPA